MGGAGLGLAIVAEVMAAHGGRVEIGESRWVVASVELWLPVGWTLPIREREPARRSDCGRAVAGASHRPTDSGITVRRTPVVAEEQVRICW